MSCVGLPGTRLPLPPGGLGWFGFFFSLVWVFTGRKVLFSSPRWLLALGTEGRLTPLVSQLGVRRVGHGWGFFVAPGVARMPGLTCLALGQTGMGADGNLPLCTGRNTELLLSDVPEAA